MSKAFAVKPIVRADRRSGEEIADMIAPGLRGVAVQASPDAMGQGDGGSQGKGGSRQSKADRTMQINFRASKDFARLISIEAEKVGGMRKWFASLAQKAGYEVPAGDLNPPSTRREW